MLGNLILKFDTLHHFLTINTTFIKQYYRVFWHLLKQVNLALFTELTSPGELVTCNVFIFGWVATLFSQTLPVHLAAYLWD